MYLLSKKLYNFVYQADWELFKKLYSLVMSQGRMGSYSVIFGILLELIILQIVKTDIPGCHFLHTVNISSSQKHQNGSYLYQDIIVPVNLTGQFDYITTEVEQFDITDSHLRGCVCHLKPCIWICCRFKDWDASNGKCTDGLMEQLSEINPLLKVTLSNGSVVRKKLLKDYIVLRDRMRMFDIWKEDKFTLFENGSILLNSFSAINVRGYDCLHPNQFDSGNTDSIVAAFHNISYYEEPQILLPIEKKLMWLSEVFLLLTIAVYLYVEKLRNLHGKCFVCYMINSFMYFIHQLLESVFIGFQLCTLQAYFMYFFLIAKFSWLLAMSHQLWRGFTSVNRAESEYNFEAYSIVAWGTSAILTGFIFLIDQIWDADPTKVDWVSGIGWENCDLREAWFYNGFVILPIVLVTAFTTTLFILTTINIIRVKLSLRHFTDQEEMAKNLNSRIEMYKVFLRLFILMDIQWSVRLTYLIFDWDLVLNICKYCDACIGLIIFVMFVPTHSTFRIIMKSIPKRRK